MPTGRAWNSSQRGQHVRVRRTGPRLVHCGARWPRKIVRRRRVNRQRDGDVTARYHLQSKSVTITRSPHFALLDALGECATSPVRRCVLPRPHCCPYIAIRSPQSKHHSLQRAVLPRYGADHNVCVSCWRIAMRIRLGVGNGRCWRWLGSWGGGMRCGCCSAGLRRVARMASWGVFRWSGLGEGVGLPGDQNANAIVTNSFGANLLALRNGDRIAYWAHSLRSVFLQPRRRRPDLLGRRLLDLIAVRRTALVVANSHFAAARLQRLYGRQADAVVYPGVDLQLFQPGAADGGYAITVGAPAPEKGFERLFELWRELPDVPLHVVGAGSVGDYERKLQRLAPANVRFMGRLVTADLADAYQNAAIAVFAPIGEEFGMAVARVHGVRDPGGCLARGRVAGDRCRRADRLSGVRFGDLPPAGAAPWSTTLNSEDPPGRGGATASRGLHWQRTAAAMESVCARLAGQPAAAHGA